MHIIDDEGVAVLKAASPGNMLCSSAVGMIWREVCMLVRHLLRIMPRP